MRTRTACGFVPVNRSGNLNIKEMDLIVSFMVQFKRLLFIRFELPIFIETHVVMAILTGNITDWRCDIHSKKKKKKEYKILNVCENALFSGPIRKYNVTKFSRPMRSEREPGTEEPSLRLSSDGHCGFSVQRTHIA